MMATYHNVNIIAKEGQWHIFLAFIPFALSVYLGFCSFLIYLFFALFAFSVYFFRNPEREIADDTAGSVLAPVDGRVEAIERLEGEKKILVRIQNGLLPTHILRSPFKTEITSIKRRHGMALVGGEESVEHLNSRCDVTFTNGVEMKVTASLFPYAPGCQFKPGDTLRHGQRIGFIFTGTVDIYLPFQTDLRINLGDTLRASESLIAIIKE